MSCGMENLNSAQRGEILGLVHRVRYPRGSYIVLSLLLSLEVATPENKLIRSNLPPSGRK